MCRCESGLVNRAMVSAGLKRNTMDVQWKHEFVCSYANFKHVCLWDRKSVLKWMNERERSTKTHKMSAWSQCVVDLLVLFEKYFNLCVWREREKERENAVKSSQSCLFQNRRRTMLQNSSRFMTLTDPIKLIKCCRRIEVGTTLASGAPRLSLTKYSCDQFSRVSRTKHGCKSMTN